MTGRGRGLCNAGRPATTTGITDNAGLGRGMRFGRGFRGDFGPETRPYRGRGLGRRRVAFQEAYAPDAQVEIDRLNLQAESLKREFDAINQRLTEMEKSE